MSPSVLKPGRKNLNVLPEGGAAMSLIRIVDILAAGFIVLAMLATSVSANTSPRVGDVEYCEASWYGPGMKKYLMPDGSLKPLTATGEIFNMDDPTLVAHRELPFGTIIRVTLLNTGESIDLEVRDRGPFAPHRCVDLSRGAAQQVGLYTGPRSGTGQARVEIIDLPDTQ